MTDDLELNVRQEVPFNAGPALAALCRREVTPHNLFFVRSHGNVPTVDPAAYQLLVDGLVSQPLALSLEEVRRDFPRVTISATLQCAGNRRQDMIAVRPIPGEVEWNAEAIGNAVWTGVPLLAVLSAARIDESLSKHVAFAGLDEIEHEGEHFNFGGSIPLEQAQHVLLAYEMNGQPLSPLHGFPLRAIVPGYIGARSAKWLGRITARPAPSDNYFQARAYKLFPPQTVAENASWDAGLMLGECSVNAAICSPAEGTRLQAGAVEVRGYAIAGGNRQVARVDVSTDGGKSWIEAELLGEGQAWTWRLWRVGLKLWSGQYKLVARAVDTAANTQPECVESVWNFKGYMNNAWHRVNIFVE